MVGTQKNRLIETVLLSAQNMFKLMGKKTITIFLNRDFFFKIGEKSDLNSIGNQNKKKSLPSECNWVTEVPH